MEDGDGDGDCSAAVEEADGHDDPASTTLLDGVTVSSAAVMAPSKGGGFSKCKDDEMLHSVVKMKLASFSTKPQINGRLNTLVMEMNRLLGEAYEFANFHVARLLAAPLGGPLPSIDRNFYYRALLAVAECDVKPLTLGPDVQASVLLFDALRPPGY